MNNTDQIPLPCPICNTQMIQAILDGVDVVMHQDEVPCPISEVVFLQEEVEEWNDRPRPEIPETVLNGLEELHFGSTSHMLKFNHDYKVICEIFQKMIVAFTSEDVYDKALQSKFKSNGVDNEPASRKDT